VFRGMSKVRAAHGVRVRREGITAQRYWQFAVHQHTDDQVRTVETVRRLLRDSVARLYDGTAPVAMMLSGGLDSSAVAGLMKEAVPDVNPLTYTVTFTDYARQFTPDQFRTTLDAPYVADVVRMVAADHHDVVLDTAELADPVARAAVIRAKDLPSMVGDMNVSAYLLCKEIRQQSSVAMSGETADSVFSGNVYTGDVGAAEFRIFPWMRLRYSRTGSVAMGGRLLAEDLLKRLDLFEYAAGRYEESCLETPLLPGGDPVEVRARQDTYLQLTRWADNQLAHSERLSLAAGVQIRMPFTDHHLIDYVYNVPPAMKQFDGREKSLLRAAVRDVIPDSVLQRKKSPFPVAVDPEYHAALSKELIAITADPAAPAAPLLSVPAIRRRLSDWSENGAHWVSRTDAEFLISFNTWLRTYGVRVVL
jgi:asparagine synthase (glutamine-hydrolysing)